MAPGLPTGGDVTSTESQGVPPEGLETHQTVAIPRNLAIVATNYSP
ncbi:hypothetical protein MY5147_006758 [Beauveria neobassiana]